MRKGLFIGINHYQHVAPLSGCNNDAMAMASVLERHANGRPNFSSKVLTSSEENLTLNTLKQQIQSLFSGDCDVALLYFAGHGQFDTSIDEGLLIPQDFKHGGEGIRISDILLWADQASQIKNKIVILDCCQAGAAAAMRGLRGGSSVIGEGMTILTACKKNSPLWKVAAMAYSPTCCCKRCTGALPTSSARSRQVAFTRLSTMRWALGSSVRYSRPMFRSLYRCVKSHRSFPRKPCANSKTGFPIPASCSGSIQVTSPQSPRSMPITATSSNNCKCAIATA